MVLYNVTFTSVPTTLVPTLCFNNTIDYSGSRVRVSGNTVMFVLVYIALINVKF